jgi:hypothetical protein
VTVPRPGWYPDPSSRGETFRWWDGSEWTDRTRTKLPSRNNRPNNRLIVLLLGFSLVVGGGVVGLFGWRTFSDTRQADRQQASGAASPTPRHTARTTGRSPGQPDGQLDETTREATLAGARMILPGAPYELVTDPVTVPHVFDAMFVANAPVHARFNGSDTWAATVGLGHIPADAWSRDDLPGFARKVLYGFSEQFFGYHPSSVERLDYGAATVSGRPCAKITANVVYRAKKPAGRHDRLVIIGCPAADGSVIAAISSVPDDARPLLSRLASKSLASLTLS